MYKSVYFKIIFIIFFAVILKTWYAFVAPITGDERKAIIVAEKIISFDLKNFNLPVEDPLAEHALLPYYILKCNSLIFGKSIFAYRIPSVALGLLTLFLIFFLSKNGIFRESEGILAMFLLSCNGFYFASSTVADNPASLQFFTMITLILFWSALKNCSGKTLLLGGIFCGIGFLAKESIIVIFPILVIYILVSPKYRFWLKKKELYLSFLFFLATVSVDVYWMIVKGTNREVLSLGFLSQVRPCMNAINFFLIRPLSFIRTIDPKMIIGWEFVTIDGLNGILLFLGSIFAFRFFKNDFYRFLIVFVIFNSLLFSFLPKGEYGWSELSIFPAVSLTSASLIYLANRKKIFRIILVTALLFLPLQAVLFLLKAKENYPPHRFASLVNCQYGAMEWYFKHGYLDESIAEVIEFLQECPNEVRGWDYLGYFYEKKGLLRQATNCWIRALEIEPNFFGPKKHLVEISDKVIEDYKKIGSADMAAKFHIGKLYYYKGSIDEALQELLDIVSRDPTIKDLHYYLGLCYKELGRTEDAIKELKEEIKNNKNSSKALLNLAMFFVEIEKNEEAISSLKRVIELNPDEARAYYWLGVIYSKVGEPEKAKEEFKRSIGIYHALLRPLYNMTGTIYGGEEHIGIRW